MRTCLKDNSYNEKCSVKQEKFLNRSNYSISYATNLSDKATLQKHVAEEENNND